MHVQKKKAKVATGTHTHILLTHTESELAEIGLPLYRTRRVFVGKKAASVSGLGVSEGDSHSVSLLPLVFSWCHNHLTRVTTAQTPGCATHVFH